MKYKCEYVRQAYLSEVAGEFEFEAVNQADANAKAIQEAIDRGINFELLRQPEEAEN
jgi:hypothetical protein